MANTTADSVGASTPLSENHPDVEVVNSSTDSDAECSSDCTDPVDTSSNSTSQKWPDLDKLVLVDPSADSDSDEILFTNPRPLATEKPRTRPPFERQLCKSRFCGVFGCTHTIGPYLHNGDLPREYPSRLGLPSTPPWDKANPPRDVWNAWIKSLPAGVGPERDNSQQRTEKQQYEVDLVDGFIAHHSWTPDEKLIHPATMVVFKQWCKSWKTKREQGFCRPKVEEAYW